MELQDTIYLLLAAIILAAGIFVAYPYLVQKPNHLSCVSQACVVVEGAGANECKTFADCVLASPSPRPSGVVYDPNAGKITEKHDAPSPTPQEDPAVLKQAQACASKLSAALSSRNISKCQIAGCPLASNYCVMAVNDQECFDLMQGKGGSESKQWDCELNIAMKASDNNLCNSLLEPRKSLCIAVRDRSYSECGSIADSFSKLVCPSLIALFNKDETACKPAFKECPELLKVLK